MDRHRLCAICWRDTHASIHCPRLRPRICYKCRRTGHYAQECPDWRTAEGAAKEGAENVASRLDVTVGLTAEDLMSVDEWTEPGQAEAVLDAEPSRKRPASPTLLQPGPSRRYRSRSCSSEDGPSNFGVKSDEDMDTQLRPGLL